ncbi:class I SAM-dependent methyltransferase [Micromonospora echinospora]
MEPLPSLELFESVYRGESLYGERAPWEIERPQAAFVELEKAGLIRGDVFDAGCGTGETSLFLAGRGYAVTAVDFSAAAIATAQRKAADGGLDVSFHVDDVLNLSIGDGQFDTVIDSGTARMFGSQGLAAYAEQLHRVCRPGAVAHVLAISEAGAAALQRRLAEEYEGVPAELPKEEGPNALRLTVDHVSDGFSRYWATESVTDSVVLYVLPSKNEILEPEAWLYRFRRI